MSSGAKPANTTPAPKEPSKQGQPASKGSTGQSGKEDQGIVLSAAETRRRRTRNIAIALTLGALVILFYVMTLARLGSNVMNRPL
ncbi:MULTISPECIES: hypothetical protein [unclassified Chelatococcus]|uniref:hypothetical protein n=1 Tax=unclassified Chelatococcus TaxID=2638111 RepID=UPI001BCC127B|nr:MULTISPECIES: hypothetical protein [unclassified Chelatococcus]MBS7695759.1 hypothetical protein [Chelatococcus sp. YT9]MBX3555866.1 hypothetical protein [Chelatococcus sp.]